MANSSRLLSVLQYLAKSHRDEAGLKERVAVVTASLFLAAPELSIKRLTADLLRFSQIQQDGGDDRLALECAAAAIFLCNERSGQALAFLEDLVRTIFLPVLTASSVFLTEKQPELAAALFSILGTQEAWLLVHQLLNKCAISLIPASRELPSALQGPLTALTVPSDPAGIEVHDDNWLRDVAPLPLHAVLPLVRDGLQAFAPGLSSSRAAAACADSNTRQLLLCSLACLFSEDASQSQAALKGLLPAAIGSARRLGGGLRRLAVAAVWDCARCLIADHSRRGTGLALLVQLQPQLFGHDRLVAGSPDTASIDSAAESISGNSLGHHTVDVLADSAFVALIQSCLVDPEPLHRKRAFFLLQRALEQPELGKPPWSLFLLLYDVLEEHAIHLIEGVWSEHMSNLLPIAEPESSSVEGSAFRLSWLMILWRRGLSHLNTQVQRLVAETLVKQPWSDSQLRELPVDFLTDSLVPVMVSANGTKEQAAQMAALNGFLVMYQQAVDPDRKWALLQALLQESSWNGLQRPQLQLMVAAVVEAAKGSGPLSSFSLASALNERAPLLAANARMILRLLQGFQGSAFKLSVSKGVVNLVARLLPGGSFSLDAAASLLETFPVSQLKPGGALRLLVQEWLQGSPAEEKWMAEATVQLFASYFGPRKLSASNAAVDEVEVANWESAADRLSRLLLTANETTGGLLEEEFSLLEERLQELYHRPYLAKGSAERALILLKALLQVIEPETVASASMGTKGASSWLQRRVASLVSNVFDELSLFTRAVWQTFWTPLPTSALPASQNGHGGLQAPEQYGLKSSKLPPSLIAAMLRANLALSTAAEGALCLLRYATAALPVTPREQGRGGTPVSPSASPSVSSDSQSPLPPLLTKRRSHSHSPDYESPLAGRRRSHQEASTSDTVRRLAASAAQFVQCFASTPLPMPKSSASAAAAQVYAEIRGRALMSLAESVASLAAATKLDKDFAAWLLKEVNLANLLQSILQMQAVRANELESARWRSLEHTLAIAEAAGYLVSELIQAKLFAAALEAVEAAHESTLPSLLRCVRFLLHSLACQPESALTTAKALGLEQDQLAKSNHFDGDNSSSNSSHLCSVFSAALKACWAAYQDLQQRSVPLTACFLQTLLLPSVFCIDLPDDERWLLHTGDGPLQWMAASLLEAGGRNPRLMALASLQLTRLLTANPAVLLLYVPSYKQLLLQGALPSETTGRSLEVEALGSGPDALDVRLTMAGIEDSPFAEFRSTELAGRVAAVCGVRSLAELAASSEERVSVPAGEAGRQLWREVFELACQDYQAGRGRSCHALSVRGKRRIRVWQAVCSLVSFALVSETEHIMRRVFETLQADNLAALKSYKETMLTFLLLRRPDLITSFLLPQIEDYSQKHETLGSAILVAAQLVFHSPAQQREQLLLPTVTAIMPWALMHHQNVRAFSQVLLQAILGRYPELWTSEASPQLHAVAAFLASNPSLRKLHKIRELALQELSPETALTPHRLFAKGWAEDGLAEEEAAMREGAPLHLLDHVIEYLAGERAQLRADVRGGAEQQAAEAASSGAGLGNGHQAATDLQRKLQPQQNSLVLEAAAAWEQALVAALPEEAAADCSCRQRAAKRQKIIVVASLLDKVPNLAGLTRTCEVFAAEALVLADLRVLKDPQFIPISVTAEQHVPLKEVPPDELAGWLSRQRQAGYTLLGLEQTAEAVSLPEYRFPEKVVLLLGREKEGIPPHLLHILDQALVIPQFGVIRSLNAHVSGSIGLWSYIVSRMAYKSES